jgi:hypothetical protein
MKQEGIEVGGSGFFLFDPFSFFEVGCGNVENPRADRVLVTNIRPNQKDGYR